MQFEHPWILLKKEKRKESGTQGDVPANKKMEFNFTQSNLFGEFFGADEMEPKAEKAKAEKPKAEKKKKKASKASKKYGNETVTLPIDVFTPWGKRTITEGEVSGNTMNDIIDFMVESGYACLKSRFFDLTLYDKEHYIVLTERGVHPSLNTLVQWGDEEQITVCNGMDCRYIQKSELENSEEATVGELLELYLEKPAEKGAVAYYDPVSNVIAFLGYEHDKKAGPLSGVTCEYITADGASGMELLEMLGEIIPAYSTANLYVCEGQLFPYAVGNQLHDKSRFAVAGTTDTTVEKQETYALPAKIKTMFGEYTVTADDLEKSKATLEEVKEGLKKKYPEFADRKLNLEYIENVGVFQALVYSSSKG